MFSDMYSKVLVFYLCLTVAFAEETSYFEILNGVRSKITHIPKLQSESREVSQIFTQIGNLHTLDSFDLLLNEIEEYIGLEDNITLCIDDLTTVLNSIRREEPWSLQVLDSFGKIQPGMLMANFHSPGFYDECKNVREQIPQNVTFISQYCSLNVPGKMGNSPIAFSFGMCVSERCSEGDLNTLIYSVMDLLPKNISLQPYVTCQKNNLKFDFKAVAAMVFAGFFVLLIIISTLLDILSSWMASSKIFETKSTSANGDMLHYAHRIGTEETPLLGSPTTELAKANPMSGCIMKFFLAFSVYSNGKKLLSTKKTASTLGAVNGVRFLSMSWVILGHTLAFGLGVVSNLGYIIPILLKRRSYHVILNALVSVDSFFLLSGLLVAYLLLKELRRNEGKKINWIAFIAKFYFHRYWRLTPPLMLLMFVYVPLFPYVSEGPFWLQNGFEPGQCNKTWWHTMLYINNFYDEECMGWTWYLANDMQFFLLSPFIIIPLYYSKWIGMLIGTSLLFASWVATGIISNYYKLPASMLEQLTHPQSMQSDYFNIYYIKPYCRIGPYIIGILFGYLLYKTDCKLKINKVLNLFVWMVAATLACLVVYGLYDELNGYVHLSQGVKDLYNTTHRTVWGACVGWVIFACATGNGGFINTLLSWSFFTPLARLTYFAYLVHPILIMGYYYSLRSAFYLDDGTLAVQFVAALVFTYMAAFILSLAFEAPMLGLEKIIFNRSSPQEEKTATSDSNHKE